MHEVTGSRTFLLTMKQSVNPEPASARCLRQDRTKQNYNNAKNRMCHYRARIRLFNRFTDTHVPVSGRCPVSKETGHTSSSTTVKVSHGQPTYPQQGPFVIVLPH